MLGVDKLFLNESIQTSSYPTVPSGKPFSQNIDLPVPLAEQLAKLPLHNMP